MNLFRPICVKTFKNSYLYSLCARSRMNSASRSNDNWRGVPITEIQGSESPWNAPEFPLVSPSFNHTVLYHIPSNGLLSDRPPKPQIGKDKWDSEFVRMPCSSHSLYPIEDSNGETHLQKRWEIIENTLWKPIKNSQELADAILSYNTNFKSIWKFSAMHKLFNEYLEEEESQHFFDVMLPEIAKLALALPKLIQSPIPLLKQHKNHSISLSQQQIASLLANAFFCTFPRRNTTKKTSEYAYYPHINFNTLYESWGSDSVLEKLKCICHYFRRICTKVPVGVVTFCRRSVPPRSCPVWPQSNVPISSLPLHIDPVNTIEDAHGLIQVDFANKYLGGGVLGYGCVQEEIRFVISPELMVSMIFTEVLRPNEALMMIGCERYSSYTGYGDNFQWSGDYRDTSPRDSSARRRVAVLAVDALPYSDIVREFTREMITRELNKAWIGISFYINDTGLQYPGLATGNWGCGAFGGTPQLKSLIQIMACAQARRPMAYYTFRDLELRDEIADIYDLLARCSVTVGQLYKYIVRFCQTDVKKIQLHSFIAQALKDEQNVATKSKNIKADATNYADVMENSITSQLQEDVPRELMNVSPDIFSEEEDSCVEIITSQHNHTVTNELCKSGDMSASDNKIAAEHNVAGDHIMAPTTNKMASDNKMAPTINIMTSDHKIAATSQTTPNHTSRLFEEMQKFDEDNGKLNFNKTHSSPLGQSKNVTIDIDSSQIPQDKQELPHRPGDMPTEVKKRITKKITDYFSKKPV